MLINLFIVIIAYLCGSLSSAIIVCKLMHLPDPRTQGSGNPGATNVLRIGSKPAAVITLAGDVLKGAIPVLAAKALSLPEYIIAAAAFAAFFGHLLPIFFKFAGGKGVATLLGCLLALSWAAGISWVIIWLFFAFLFRYSSLASLGASLVAPFLVWYFSHSSAYATAVAAMLPFLIYKHRLNIEALIKGNERKIGQKLPS